MNVRVLGVAYPIAYTAVGLPGLLLAGGNLPRDAEHFPHASLMFLGSVLHWRYVDQQRH